jgi:hypothetical protein
MEELKRLVPGRRQIRGSTKVEPYSSTEATAQLKRAAELSEAWQDDFECDIWKKEGNGR